MRRTATVLVSMLAGLSFAAAPASACGGLIGPNGAVNLLRTTTFAGFHAGVEHYVTAFEYGGDGEAFGSITPLPGVPSSVEKGGDWTLQRLIRETDPQPVLEFESIAQRRDGADEVEILLETRIDALDITVLKGGGEAVVDWATERGYQLSDDAPEVLDFYARRSPIFLAADFDAAAAAERGQFIGDGTPVHVTIPTTDPWVPLRILSLGKQAREVVQADIYLMTDEEPAMLPAVRPASTASSGLILDHSAHASQSLLDDLRSDRGMEWVPDKAWLTKVRVQAEASTLLYDLAVDASGQGTPSRVAAGLDPMVAGVDGATIMLLPLLAVLVASGTAMGVMRRTG